MAEPSILREPVSAYGIKGKGYKNRWSEAAPPPEAKSYFYGLGVSLSLAASEGLLAS